MKFYLNWGFRVHEALELENVDNRCDWPCWYGNWS